MIKALGIAFEAENGLLKSRDERELGVVKKQRKPEWLEHGKQDGESSKGSY